MPAPDEELLAQARSLTPGRRRQSMTSRSPSGVSGWPSSANAGPVPIRGADAEEPEKYGWSGGWRPVQRRDRIVGGGDGSDPARLRCRTIARPLVGWACEPLRPWARGLSRGRVGEHADNERDHTMGRRGNSCSPPPLELPFRCSQIASFQALGRTQVSRPAWSLMATTPLTTSTPSRASRVFSDRQPDRCAAQR
jgi:hypothetical protein